MMHSLDIGHSAKEKETVQNHYGSVCMCPTVGDIKLAAGKVYLHFFSRDIGVVKRKVVRILVITDKFLELGILITVEMCFEVLLM